MTRKSNTNVKTTSRNIPWLRYMTIVLFGGIGVNIAMCLKIIGTQIEQKWHIVTDLILNHYLLRFRA